MSLFKTCLGSEHSKMNYCPGLETSLGGKPHWNESFV